MVSGRVIVFAAERRAFDTATEIAQSPLGFLFINLPTGADISGPQ